MTTTILVTGAAGFIGSHLCEALLDGGFSVVGLDNMIDFYDPQEKRRNLEAIRTKAQGLGRQLTFGLIDIRDMDRVQAWIKESSPQAVIHLAAMAGVRPSIAQPRLYEEINVAGTQNILAGIKEKKIPLIFGSSSSVYGNDTPVPFAESAPAMTPISPYAATKRAGELLCHTAVANHQLQVMCLRFFTVYGPRQRPDLAIRSFMQKIHQGQTITLYGAGTSRDYTFVDDIVRGVLGALDRLLPQKNPLFEIYNLGSSHPVGLQELVAGLEKIVGKKAQVATASLPIGDVTTTYADLARSQKVLGYSPQTSLPQGLEKMYQWFKKELHA